MVEPTATADFEWLVGVRQQVWVGSQPDMFAR